MVWHRVDGKSNIRFVTDSITAPARMAIRKCLFCDNIIEKGEKYMMKQRHNGEVLVEHIMCPIKKAEERRE